MNNQIKKKSLFSVLTILIFSGTLYCQNPTNITKNQNDSLSLKSVIQQVISTYPSVKVAEEALNNADARIGQAKTGYNPVFDLTASFANLGPVTKLTLPTFGTFQLYPDNNYAASINYQQLLYDFGRTHQNVELENENKIISEQTLEQVKQKLSLLTVGNFYALLYLQAAIKIKDEQLTTLKEHLDYVEKQKANGTATDYQILTTKVKISTVE